MNIIFAPQAWEEYLYRQANDRKMAGRIHQLLNHVLRGPYEGIGKPEPLQNALRVYWSRRIDLEHRMVYKASEVGVLVAQWRYHDED